MENNIFSEELYMPPDIFVQQDEAGRLFLYHTQKGTHMITSDTELCRIVKDIYSPKNLGVIGYDTKNASSKYLKAAIQGEFIKIVPVKDDKTKFINFLPILNLQNDFSKYENPDDIPHLRRNTIRFLSGLNIFLSYENKSSSNEERDFKKIASKQILSTPVNDSEQYLNLADIKKIMLQAAHSSIKKINFIQGCDFFEKVNYTDFLNLLSAFDFEYHFHFFAGNFFDCDTSFADINVNISYNIYLNRFSKEEHIAELLSIRFKNKCYIHCLVTSDEDCDFFTNHPVLKEFGSEINFIPVWTGKNTNFFKKNVFITQEDLNSKPVSMHHIFRNKKLNANFLGILAIYPDKSVCASGSRIKLGDMDNCSLTELVYKELKVNTAWRKTRDLTACKNCFFCFLCPPVSVYETVANKFDMCTVDSNKI
jgi:pseudo-rSAM protein